MDDRQQDIPGWWIRNSSGNESQVAINRRRAEQKEHKCLSCGLNVVCRSRVQYINPPKALQASTLLSLTLFSALSSNRQVVVAVRLHFSPVVEGLRHEIPCRQCCRLARHPLLQKSHSREAAHYQPRVDGQQDNQLESDVRQQMSLCRWTVRSCRLIAAPRLFLYFSPTQHARTHDSWPAPRSQGPWTIHSTHCIQMRTVHTPVTIQCQGSGLGCLWAFWLPDAGALGAVGRCSSCAAA